ncbi:S8 family serine peptidase [Danxiaibacter flavus]|uniref:S8 family serine peptidase n=1 Tax=Danxiaibacter flavus TaxID=3049108 RepID=A0ABV3ZE23_9BACT|nr:S8 family serine peptidase [Chitinophagaceae bacterium DXS]
MNDTLKNCWSDLKFFLAIALLAATLIVPACKCHHKRDYPKNAVSYEVLLKNRNYDTNQVIIWLKPGISKDSLNRWLKTFDSTGKIADTVFCKGCDGSLLLLKGTGALTLIQSARGGNQSSASSKPSGDNGPFYYSANFPVSFNDTMQQQEKREVGLVYTEPVKSPVVVAVFDTGVKKDSLQSNVFFQSNVTSCLGTEANSGWNFTRNNNDWNDDYPNIHGTLVSKYIVDQVRQYGLNNVKILPVKTHDAAGNGNLFSVLCGFAYAKERGAKIINASFGYYAPKYYMDVTGQIIPDSSAFLLKAYINEYLTKNKILLVTAAGNIDFSGYESKIYPTTNALALRNLDSICFYPASLAGELNNVIAATTVMNGNVSANQNFSNKIVDVGVNGDLSFGTNFYFYNPFVPFLTETGSSFAAPIVTGKICANYDRILPVLNSTNFSQTLLFLTLQTPPSVVVIDSRLHNKIRNSIVTNKRK